jgi:hypothetical protein
MLGGSPGVAVFTARTCVVVAMGDAKVTQPPALEQSQQQSLVLIVALGYQ